MNRVVLAVVGLAAIGCSMPKASTRVIYSNRLSSLDAIITRTGVTLGTALSPDRKGVIRLDSTDPTTIRLAEVRLDGVEDVTLVYRGHLRTQALRGHAYLEMLCSIRGVGELPSKLSGSSVTGTTDWVSQQTEFFVDEGR